VRVALPSILAGIDLGHDITPSSGQPNALAHSAGMDVIIVLSAVLVVVVVLFASVYFLRGTGKQRRSRGSVDRSSAPEDLVKTEVVEGSSGRRRVRYRRRRRGHRGRNPTLAETGGLPPERPEST
jgi:hypothetical protein